METKDINNQIETYLNEIIVDFFCNKCEFEGLSEEEQAEKLMGVDGLEAEDKEVVANNIDTIDDEFIQDETYAFIKETHHEVGITAPNLVKYLAKKMYIYHYDDENKAIIHFLKNASLEEILTLFEENDDFGRAMISAFINCETYEQDYKAIADRIKEDEPTIFEKFKLDPPKYNVTTINGILRNVVCNLYNHYIAKGCDDITALNNVWAYFDTNFDPLGELDKMGYDYNTKEQLKKFIICLIYADIYEDVANTSIINSTNYEDRLAASIPFITSHIGLISIPKEEGVRNRILKYFILLQEEKEKKQANRLQTHKDKRTHILKKVNPSYILDELTF